MTQDTDTTAQPTPPSSATPSRSPDQGGVSLLTTIIVAALFSAFSSVLSWSFATGDRVQATPVVMVDGAKLVELQAKAALSKPGMTVEQAESQGKEFVQQLNNALSEYTQAGIIVVNSSVVLNRPGSVDVTAAVAQKLGIKFE
ncbi:hypothetical protein [Cupriavidus pauculus]|uniref:Uncharacterized protein n=1 Tax=Cupriavidus pauculus TaxID=82633 RepID=A0A3G8GW15_9BURK|nr:hypothetical protein [Cupriavidus pauculus]AZG12169.1 hypothetical protein EHF44_01500 [Cupriavidus pauculus]